MTDNLAILSEHRRAHAPRVRRKTPHAKLSHPERAALRDLGQYIILTPDAFAMCSGYASTATCGGLQGLFDKGLADRGYYRPPRSAKEIAASARPAHSKRAYKLTSDGMKRGIAEGLIAEGTPFIKKLWSGLAPGDMSHRMLIVELMIKIRLEIATQNRLVVGRMTPDFLRPSNRSVNKDWISPKRFLVPDLIFGLETFCGELEAMFFVEIEQTKLQPVSTCATRTTIATKLEPYTHYLKSPHREIKGGEQDVLLYVQNHPPAHLDKVIPLVPWDKVGAVRNLVRFTTFEEIREHGALSAPWRDWRGERVRIVD